MIKRIAALAFGAVVSFAAAAGTFAADSQVTYQGGAEAFVVIPEGKDLFQNFKGVMPGDVLTQPVIVQNTVSSQGGVRLYLRAEASDETVQGFLEQMTLTVKQGDTVLSQDAADQAGGLTENVLLGTFFGEAQVPIDAVLTVPITMGNEFQNASGTIRWIFTAEELDADPGNNDNNGNTSGGGSGNGGGGGGGRDRDRSSTPSPSTTTIGDPDPALSNLENISDEEVPLATNPILQAIEDVLVPLGILPKTGDGSVSYGPLLAALAVSGMLIILLVWKRRKKAE